MSVSGDLMREYLSRRSLLLDEASATEILTFLMSEHEREEWYPAAVSTVNSQEMISLDRIPDAAIVHIYEIMQARENQLRERARPN